MTQDEAVKILKEPCLLTAQDVEPTAKVYLESQVLAMLEAQKTLTKYNCSKRVRGLLDHGFSNEIDALLYAAVLIEKEECDYCSNPVDNLAGTPYLADGGKKMCKKCWDITPTEEDFPENKSNVHGVKVKNFYYREPTKEERKHNTYWTGLTFELENGLVFQQNSTDVIEPYSLSSFDYGKSETK